MRTPVIVGAAQRTYRSDPPSPLDQMEEVARAAAGPLLAKVASVGVVESFSWPVANPAGPLAGRLKIEPRETVRTARGGNGPVALLADYADRIARGELDVALVAGGEAMTPYMQAVRAGEPAAWLETTPGDDGGAPTRVVGVDRDASHDAEKAAGLIAPIFYYPLIEHAHRAAAGRTTEEHVQWIASWWSRFSAVAASHEHAWSREELTPRQVATPGPGNRLVSSPYTKVMNANIQVDQAAALVVCSAEAATAAGIPTDEWVFVHGAAGGEDHWFVGERRELHRSPVLQAIGAALDAGQADHVDLYSCFPSAVQTAALEFGIDLDERTPTVTGGLAFFGGPANNYATHSVATLVDRLREEPGRAVATAVGWYLTKHHAVALGSDPATFVGRSYEPRGQPLRIAHRAAGPVESFTALYDREGTPTLGIVAVREDGRRAFGRTEDPARTAALEIGEPARVRDGALL
jgi:acetyl-CoA C-acetyltransferase